MNKPRIFFILVAAALFVTGCAAETEETTAGGENIHVTDKGVSKIRKGMSLKRLFWRMCQNVHMIFRVLRRMKRLAIRVFVMKKTGLRHAWG